VTEIYLASKSPRRHKILQDLGVTFEVIECNFDEALEKNESAEDFITRNTQQKNLLASAMIQEKKLPLKPVLSADTLVRLDDKIFGKPKDEDHAISMLLELSNREHIVSSCICLGEFTKENDSEIHMSYEIVDTVVKMGSISANECKKYWNTGEPKDKAGGYAIQGLGSIFIESITGSYSNVVGLPIRETTKLLKDKKIKFWINK